eukprot:8095451-Pyramimonas_sp.AAC.1
MLIHIHASHRVFFFAFGTHVLAEAVEAPPLVCSSGGGGRCCSVPGRPLMRGPDSPGEALDPIFDIDFAPWAHFPGPLGLKLAPQGLSTKKNEIDEQSTKIPWGARPSTHARARPP